MREKVRGELNIGDFETSLISTFPHVALKITDVSVRDTLWKQHGHELLKAKKAFIRLELFSIFTKHPVINKVILENGAVYLFKDSTGYSNEYIFSRRKNKSLDEPLKTDLPHIELKDMRVVLDFRDRNKLYDFSVNQLTCKVRNKDTVIFMDIKTTMVVNSLTFNTNNGSFIRNKPLDGKFTVELNRSDKQMRFKDIRLNVDHHPFIFSGQFKLNVIPPLYKLSIRTDQIRYKQVASLISNNISRKLTAYDIEKPIDIHCTIDGLSLPNRIPRVTVFVEVNNSSVITPVAKFDAASFTGTFSNHLAGNKPPFDDNSGFSFHNFSGRWESITLHADSVTVTNLEKPMLQCDLHSDFDLAALNDISGSNFLKFTNGKARMDLIYRGALLEDDTTSSSISGFIHLENAGINYLPRRFLLKNGNGRIRFDDKDVYVNDLRAKIGNSTLVMNGSAKNMVSLINQAPENLLLNWNISSPHLDLRDFISYVGKRTDGNSSQAAKRRLVKLASRVDRMLHDTNVELALKAKQLDYKKFTASDAKAMLLLTNEEVQLKDVSLMHAGGQLSLNGKLKEGKNHNPFNIEVRMKNVDITRVFTAFNNFGQDGIMDKNIRGRLSTLIRLQAAITDKANLVENSLRGIMDISLVDGELINFEPVEKIAENILKKRDFSHIRFAELKDRLEVNGTAIKVNRMEIRSSAFDMFVEGVYDIKKGTDLSIQIPLSNLKKRDDLLVLENKGVNSSTGISLRLRAKTGADGKAKISWDPFKRALKGG